MINRLPFWFRQELPDMKAGNALKVLRELNVNTVCQESFCPNLSRCFKEGKLTFLILGTVCSRSCLFCAIDKAKSTHLSLDVDEPNNIKEVVKKLNLKYVIITSVTRDDLEDFGALQFRRTIEEIRKISDSIKIEALIPDFKGSFSTLSEVVEAGPDMIGHNLETVERLYPIVRPDAIYRRSLNILRIIKELDNRIITKSSLILGLGEEKTEVLKTIEDLFSVGTDILTLGQYLAPSYQHYPVKEFIHPEQFNHYKDFALSLGFKAVASGPLVRSSSQAEELYSEVIRCTILS